MRANPIAADLFDLAAVEQVIDRWPTGDWNCASARTTYSMDLTAILATGVFLTEFSRWGPRDKSLHI